jgi:hypothetical protein
MRIISRTQAFGLVAVFVGTLVTGVIAFKTSVEAARGATSASGDVTASQNGKGQTGSTVPIGFITKQDGAPLSIRQATGGGEYCFTQVSVGNVSEQRVASATFVAVVEHLDRVTPAIVVRTEPIPVALDPGMSAQVTIALLPIRDVLEWKTSRGVRAQAVLGLLEVGFADGDKWSIVPPADATSENEVFLRPRPEVSRALIALQDGTPRPSAACRDDRGFEYSRGALVPIRGEENAIARCVDGVWIEQKAGTPTAGSVAQEDFRLQCDIARDGTRLAGPVLRGKAGQELTVDITDQIRLTLVPTRLGPGQVRVVVGSKAGAIAAKVSLFLLDQDAGTVSLPGETCTFELTVRLLK